MGLVTFFPWPQLPSFLVACLTSSTVEQQLQTDLSKFFKPITETQKATAREITEELKPIKEGIANLPQVTFPAYPSIKPSEGDGTQYIGKVAGKYLRKYASKDEADRKYGLYDDNGKFKIGEKLAIIVDNDLILPPVYGNYLHL